jgi:hypothetical protein
MGINAEHWGKQGWHFIHTITLGYPIEPTDADKQNYLTFLKSLEIVLPCPFCAEHFKQNMIKIPPRLDNSIEFFNWSVDMHNEVNKMNGKPILTYEQAKEELIKNSKTKEQIQEELRLKSIEAQSVLRKIKKLKK